MHYLAIIFIAIFFGGCAGVGLQATSDPNVKIQQAYRMMDEDRALMAEDLIRQAIEGFEKTEDAEGMAESYFAYGNLYKHRTYHKHRAIFEKWGTYDGSYAKSISNFENAVREFEKAGSEIGAVKSLAGIGEAYNSKNEEVTACSFYAKALARYNAGKGSGAIDKEPVIYAKGAKNVGQVIEALMKREKCT